MKWASLPAALMAAVCLYAGFYYLGMFARRRGELRNLFFSLTCFSISLYDFFCAALYNASSLSEGMHWQRYQFASLALFTIMLSWFIYYSVEYREKRIFVVSTVVLLLFFVLGLTVRNELTLSLANPRVKHVELGGLLSITYMEVNPGLIYRLQYIVMMFMALYVFYIGIRYFIDSEMRPGNPFLVAVIVLFAVTINDSLVGAGVYRFIYLLEYAYLFLIVYMASVLQNNFIDLNREVEELNVQLEEKINERTMELFFSEIGRGLYVEMLKEIPCGDDLKEMESSVAEEVTDRRMETVQKLSQDISIISNIEELLNRALNKAMEISGAITGCLYMVNEMNETERRSFRSLSPVILSAEMEELTAKVFREQSYIITGSMRENGEDGTETIRPAAGRNVLIMPIYLRKDIIGVGYLEKAKGASVFTDTDARLLRAYMDQSANAMEYAFFYQRMINRKGSAAGGESRKPSISSTTEDKIRKALAYIEENYTSDISREGLAASLNMHPDSLGRFFRMYTDKKISEYINELRVRDAAKRLRETDENIIDIAFSVGFESLTTFNRAFLKEMKITPTSYRKGDE